MEDFHSVQSSMDYHQDSNRSNLNISPEGIETGLPSRYEIRQLDESHLEWGRAISSHSNTFDSPLWRPLLKGNLTARCYESYTVLEYMLRYQVESGCSIGIFDTEYEFKRPESAATGGKLWWDLEDTNANRETLLEQMDFPLISVAFAYDSFKPFDMEQLIAVFSTYPQLVSVYQGLSQLDTRDPSTWQAKKPGEVLFRNSTATREDYAGKGMMKKLAHYLMRRSAQQGFRGIQIESSHPAVEYVWSHPPAPFKGEVVAGLETATWEEKGKRGEVTYPFRPADVRLSTCYVSLK